MERNKLDITDRFIEALNNKSKKAFKELFDTFYNSLVLFAYSYVKDSSVAEDLVQEVFVKIWEKEQKFISYNSTKTYLYNSVKNSSLNYIEHKKVQEKYVTHTLNNSKDYDDLEELEIENEVYRQLFKAIEELPPKCKDVFKLHLEGKNNDEIAEILQISRLTAKTHKQNAKIHIKEKIGSLYVYLIFLEII